MKKVRTLTRGRRLGGHCSCSCWSQSSRDRRLVKEMKVEFVNFRFQEGDIHAWRPGPRPLGKTEGESFLSYSPHSSNSLCFKGFDCIWEQKSHWVGGYPQSHQSCFSLGENFQYLRIIDTPLTQLLLFHWVHSLTPLEPDLRLPWVDLDCQSTLRGLVKKTKYSELLWLSQTVCHYWL